MTKYTPETQRFYSRGYNAGKRFAQVHKGLGNELLLKKQRDIKNLELQRLVLGGALAGVLIGLLI